MRYGILMSQDRARFNLKFDGPAVEDHSIDVNDLAPSLLEWATALSIVSEEVAPNNPTARLTITPDSAQEGSFLMEMSIDLPGIIDQAISFLHSREGSAIESAATIASTLIAAVGIVYGGKRAQKSRSTKQQEKEDQLAEKISTDPRFIESVQKATKPVLKPGFTEITISAPANQNQKFTITTATHQAVENETEEKTLIRESIRDVVVTIENLDFQEGKTWKLHDGDKSFKAAIRDNDFQRRIDEGEIQFGKQDLLEISLLTQQYQLKSGRLKNYHFVTKVKKHDKKGPPENEQFELPFDE